MKLKLIEVYPENCTGCERCGMACSFHFERESSITKSRIRVLHDKDKFAWDLPILCIQCAEAPCIENCPVGALYRDESSVVVVVDDICIGCDACIDACPLHALALDKEKGVVFKCNLCGGNPECVKWCDRGVLTLKEVDLDSPARKAYVEESFKRLQRAI